MMAEFASILPTNATPWERGVERASGERWDVLDIDIIRRFKNPWHCPPHLLNFLAFERSVDIWDESWPELKKRAVIASAPIDHRLKGTLAGIQRYIELSGAKLVKAIVPPDQAFPGRPMTIEERRAFMRRYPEVRVYSYRNRSNIGFGIAPAIGFVGARRFLILSTAKLRFGRQAYLYRDGVETPLETVSEMVERQQQLAVDYDEVRQPGLALGSFVSYQPQQFMVPSTAASRIFRIRLEQAYEDVVRDYKVTTVKSGLDPLGYDPEKIAEPGHRGFGSFVNDCLARRFLMPSTAGERLYDRLYLFDPAIPIARRQKSFYMNTSRLGMPAFHAKLRVKMVGKRRLSVAGRYCTGFIYASPKDNIARMHSAIRSSAALRDRILVNTKTVEPATASPILAAGQIVAGQLQEII